MRRINKFIAAAAIAVSPSVASADCGIGDSGEVNVLTNFFETLELLASVMEECETDALKVDVKMTTDHKAERERAFEAAVSPYNAQHLYYRKDLFEKHGLEVPATYEDLLAAAEVLSGDDSIDYPFSAAFGGSGNWELGNEFVNILLATGGTMFDPATSEPTFDGPEGLQALELMGELMKYMSPNALSLDFGAVKQQLQQGEVAMAILWGDQAPAMDKEGESTVIGKVGFAVAPSMTAGGPPATTFWWDGYVIPKNLDGDPETAFKVIMHAVRSEVVEQNNDVTLWIRSSYVPTQYTAAIIDSVLANAPPYPMNPQSEMAHGAIGNNIGDFLAGKESAAQSLADAASDYVSAAADAGLISQ